MLKRRYFPLLSVFLLSACVGDIQQSVNLGELTRLLDTSSSAFVEPSPGVTPASQPPVSVSSAPPSAAPTPTIRPSSQANTAVPTPTLSALLPSPEPTAIIEPTPEPISTAPPPPTRLSPKVSITETTIPINLDLSAPYFVINPQNIWIAGAGGQLYQSKTGGMSWTSHQRNKGLHFKSIFFLNEQDGWLGAANGQLLHTSDGGKSWEPIDLGFDDAVYQDIVDIGFIDENHGYVLFFNFILETNDGGKTWIKHNVSADHIGYLSKDKLIVHGKNVMVYEGNNWSTTFSLNHNGTSVYIIHMVFKNEQEGYLFSHGEQPPYWTKDGGYTWELLSKVRLDDQIIRPENLSCMDFNESGKAIAHFGRNNGNNFGYTLPFVFNDGTNDIWTGPSRENVVGNTYYLDFGQALFPCGSRAYRGNSVYIFFGQNMMKLSLQNI